MAERLIVDPMYPDPSAIERAADMIRDGGVVACPTDTYYGLSVDPRQASAVTRLFAVKRRAPGSSLPLMAADAGQLETLAVEWSESRGRLATDFWPGPLTLVLRAGVSLPDGVMGPGSTIAIRVPDCPIAQALARAAHGPVTSTSANLSGRPPLVSADDVLAELGESIDLLLDGGLTPGGAPSTIVDVTQEPPRLVRDGLVPWARVLESLEG